MTTDAAIETTGLTKRFRRGLLRGSALTAVDGLDLVVPRGSTFGLLGPNGAGKTTTIQMVLGLIAPSAGTSSVLGGSMSEPDIRRRIGFVPEKFQLPGFLTAEEFLRLHAALAGIEAARRDERVLACLRLVNLEERRGDRLKGFSKGMQQRMMIAQAMLPEPDLLILDEPTSALDPLGRREVRELIVATRSRGTTIVLNSHLLGEVEAVCDRVAIMRAGRVVHEGSISDLGDRRMHAEMRVGRWSDQLRDRLTALVDNLDVQPAADGQVSLRFSVGSSAALPGVAAAVHDAGGELFALIPGSESLEDLFVRLVGGSDVPGEVSAPPAVEATP